MTPQVQAFLFGVGFGAIPTALIVYLASMVGRESSDKVLERYVKKYVNEAMRISMDRLFASEQIPVKAEPKLPELPNV